MEARAAAFDMEGEINSLLEDEAEKAKAIQASERARASAAMAHDNGEVAPAAAQPLGRQVPDNSREMSELRQHMISQGGAINALIASVNQMNEKSAEPPVEQAPDPVVKVEEKEPAPELALLEGMSSLKIEFLAEGKPQRPQYDTYFEMPKMGTMQARYHAVVTGKDCMALVYDTRFEDGFQYLPPNLGAEEVQVSVPKLGDAVYTCTSLGLHWTLGCLDIVILIKINKEVEE
jgi:hypothetical protein